MVGYAETGDRRFISTDGDAAYVVVQLDVTDEQSVDLVDGSERKSPRRPATPTSSPATARSPRTRPSSPRRTSSAPRPCRFPSSRSSSILVFASLVAAGMPLLVAGLAIPTHPRPRSTSWPSRSR